MNETPDKPLYVDGFQPLTTYKKRHGLLPAAPPVPLKEEAPPDANGKPDGNSDRWFLLLLLALLAENGAPRELLIALAYLAL